MPKTKIIKASEDAIEMMTQREQMSYSGAYETAKSTNSSMDVPYENVMEYISY